MAGYYNSVGGSHQAKNIYFKNFNILILRASKTLIQGAIFHSDLAEGGEGSQFCYHPEYRESDPLLDVRVHGTAMEITGFELDSLLEIHAHSLR